MKALVMQRGVKHAGTMSGDREASCPEVRLIEVAKSMAESSEGRKGLRVRSQCLLEPAREWEMGRLVPEGGGRR